MFSRDIEDEIIMTITEPLDPLIWAGVETWLSDWKEEEPEWTR